MFRQGVVPNSHKSCGFVLRVIEFHSQQNRLLLKTTNLLLVLCGSADM